jgi:hypothetical protein
MNDKNKCLIGILENIIEKSQKLRKFFSTRFRLKCLFYFLVPAGLFIRQNKWLSVAQWPRVTEKVILDKQRNYFLSKDFVLFLNNILWTSAFISLFK